MLPSTFCVKLVKAYFLAGIFISLLSCGFSSVNLQVNCINSQEFVSTQAGSGQAIPIEVTYAQLSADSGDTHDYAKHEEGPFYNNQIARGYSLRYFKTLNTLLSVRNISLPLPMKLAALPSSVVAEQQRSIPVFLRRLLI